MIKNIAVLAVLLSGCATAKPVVVAPPAPVKVEMSNSNMAQAVACSDDFDCLKRMTGMCKNGYAGSKMLLGTNESRVGVVFKCITDEQVAEEQAEELAWQERLAQLKAQAEKAREKAAPKKK